MKRRIFTYLLFLCATFFLCGDPMIEYFYGYCLAGYDLTGRVKSVSFSYRKRNEQGVLADFKDFGILSLEFSPAGKLLRRIEIGDHGGMRSESRYSYLKNDFLEKAILDTRDTFDEKALFFKEIAYSYQNIFGTIHAEVRVKEPDSLIKEKFRIKLANGKPVMIEQRDSRNISLHSYTYDTRGNLISARSESFDSADPSEKPYSYMLRNFEYDEKGRLVKDFSSSLKRNARLKNPDFSEGSGRESVYAFDDSGFRVKEERRDFPGMGKGGSSSYEYEYQSDSFGNWTERRSYLLEGSERVSLAIDRRSIAYYSR